MLIKTILVDGKNKLVQVTELSFTEFLEDKYHGDEKTIREALKKQGMKPQLIENEIEKLKKDFRRYCNVFQLNN